MKRIIAIVGLLALCGPATAAGDGAEVSKHRGKKDGLIVLWPRVVPGDPKGEAPADIDDLAAQVHQRLGQIAQRNTDDNKLIIRPSPERVCPQRGCRAISVGAVLGYHQGGCFAVGLIGEANGGKVRMIPWGGEVLASRKSVPHREPPENKLLVKEFVPCEQLMAELDDEKVARALQAAITTGATVELAE